MKKLSELYQTITEAQKITLKLYPVSDKMNQIEAVQIGEPFKLSDKTYFEQIRTLLTAFVGFVASPFDKYETAVETLREDNVDDSTEVVWLFNADEGDHAVYIISTEFIK